MPTHPPYPAPLPPLRILDPTATLLATPTSLPTEKAMPALVTSLPPLAYLLLADRLAELYETIFPDKPHWLVEETVDWQSENDVAAAVERFLHRVSALFPIHDEIWDVDTEVVEWRLWEIPVMPLGYDEWHDEWDEWEEPAPYLLHLRHSRHHEDSAYWPSNFADLYPDHLLSLAVEPHRLVTPLRQMDLPEPLAALPDLIQMLEHDTGNVWLDVGEMSLAEGGGYPHWSLEQVTGLAEEWRKADPIFTRIQRLLAWQDDAPDEIDSKLTAVRDILLAAYTLTQETLETTEEMA